MICRAANGQIAPGKWKETEEWCLEVAAYVNRQYPSANALVMRNISGQNEGILYVDMWDSLGAWEQAVASLDTQAEFQALMAKSEGLFAPGSIHHTLFRVVR